MYYKMPEFIQNCVEYYEKRGEPGYKEMRKRYNILDGKMVYTCLYYNTVILY